MRIGVLTYDYDPPIGGLGVVAKQTKNMLQTLFPLDEYTVFSPSSGADHFVHSLAKSRYKKSGGCPLFSLLLIFVLPRLLRQFQLDLLHVHAGSGGVFLLRKQVCPVVVTAHHTYLQEARIVFKNSLVKKYWKIFMSILERRTYTIADRIVCVSQDTASYIQKEYDQSPSKICVIENGLENKEVDSPIAERDLETLVFVGRLEERKGIWTLLEAMKRIHTSHQNVRLQLIGKNLLGDVLEQWIANHGLSETIILTGYLEDVDMRRALQSATALVIPSLLEGFGLIAAEGMLMGTCVVVSDAYGLRSIIKNDETGLVFSSEDSSDCARVLLLALNDPLLRERVGQAAKKEAENRFSLVERTKDLHEIFINMSQAK